MGCDVEGKKDRHKGGSEGKRRNEGNRKKTGAKKKSRNRAPEPRDRKKEAQEEAASSQPGEAGTFLPARSAHSCTEGP